MYFSNILSTNIILVKLPVAVVFVAFLLGGSFADPKGLNKNGDVFENYSLERFVRAVDVTNAPVPGVATADPEIAKAAAEAARKEKVRKKKEDLEKWRKENSGKTDRKDPLETYTYEWDGKLNHGQECRSKEEIQKLQAGRPDMTKDDKTQYISENSCNAERFLTCIVPKNKTVEEGELYDKYAGTCQCHAAVGGMAGILGEDGTCRIPANQGINSDCGGHKAVLKTYEGKSLKASCADGAECLPGDLFTGQRCQCKIGYEGEGGRCSSGWRFVSSTPLTILTFSGLIYMLFLCPLLVKF